MLREVHTIQLDGPIPPSPWSHFFPGRGIDSLGSIDGGFYASWSTSRDGDTSSTSIGGGNDASSSGCRDADDAFAGEDGSIIS